ncbi:MAG: PEP-CTERM sorting domain-containing protein [Desulfobacterium sp.]|nr:PEP-CTERM sorting domain-containing protein [Desulfobacterium sp.]
MNLISKVLGIVFLGLGLASAAGAATFNLNNDSNNSEWDSYGYDSLTYTKDGIGLTVTAWRDTDSLTDGPWVYKSSKNNGLGVNNGLWDNSVDIEYSGSSRWDEGLLFTFDQAVTLTKMEFRYVDEEDDMVIFEGVGGKSFGTYGIELYGSNEHGKVEFDSPLNGTTFLVKAPEGDDDFFVNSIKATARTQVPAPTVPVPSTVLLLGAGLAGFVGIRKRVAV